MAGKNNTTKKVDVAESEIREGVKHESASRIIFEGKNAEFFGRFLLDLPAKFDEGHKHQDRLNTLTQSLLRPLWVAAGATVFYALAAWWEALDFETTPMGKIIVTCMDIAWMLARYLVHCII